MKLKEILESLGGSLLFGAILIIIVFIAIVIIRGGAWVSIKILPVFSIITIILFLLNVFIFLPLAIFKTTRHISSTFLFISSYIFGATLWMEGFLLTLVIWGFWAVFIGLFIAGVGVVPIAMLATIVKGMWGPFIELILLAILTYASRAGAFALAREFE